MHHKISYHNHNKKFFLVRVCYQFNNGCSRPLCIMYPWWCMCLMNSLRSTRDLQFRTTKQKDVTRQRCRLLVCHHLAREEWRYRGWILSPNRVKSRLASMGGVLGKSHYRLHLKRLSYKNSLRSHRTERAWRRSDYRSAWDRTWPQHRPVCFNVRQKCLFSFWQ